MNRNNQKIKFKDKRIELSTLKGELNQTLIELNLNVKDIKVERHFVSAPTSWMLDIQGTPIKGNFVEEIQGDKKLSTEEFAKIKEDITSSSD